MPLQPTNSSFFSLREDASTGRRWRWSIPWARVILAVLLTIIGLSLSIAGLSLRSFELGITGLIMLVPGLFASRVYAGVLWRGEEVTRPDVFFEQVDEVI
jgi:hypothetical protein